MLSRLHVRNYVLIDSLDTEFPEGLIIITGQTGAGKSILLGALSLLMGAKADASMVSEGAENCVVEAEFALGDETLRHILEENDVEWDEGHLIIRRVVNRSGRSRAFVNDSPVSVSVLQEISSHIVDIHSQHQTLMLADKQFQLDILDLFAGNASLKSQFSDLWKERNALQLQLNRLEDKILRLSSEKDYNEAQFKQLESAALREGELAELEEEQKHLANAEDIKSGLAAVEELFTSASNDEVLSIDASLKESGRLLSKLANYLPSLSELSQRIDSARAELDDILSEVSDLNSVTDLSPERLDAVESRMSLIYGLMKKHGCSDEAELIQLRDNLSQTLCDSTLLEEQRDELRKQFIEKEVVLADMAEQLHLSRTNAAESFAECMTESIRDLELPYSIFEVELRETAMTATGRDAVIFRFSSSGKNAVDLAKCASGGEMSRIMLALKSMRARYVNMPTMIFDEIDTGVSGSVADKMGSMICEMGAYMQVFAITHLPQVAAKGSAHYLVSKEIDSDTSKAVSTISMLSDDQRVMEVARMLSGSVLTDAAIANAKSLLEF